LPGSYSSAILAVFIIFIALIIVFFVVLPAPDVIPASNATIEQSGAIVYRW
jgi:hypothetical protein